MAVIVMGMIRAAEVLEEDHIETPESEVALNLRSGAGEW